MAFDGLLASSIIAELNNTILNGKINKIYQPNKNEILLGIYSMGKNYALNICIDSINYRLNLTTHQKANPKNVFNFCMVLRKHLIGSTIKNIYMNDLERVIYVDCDCYNELNDLTRKTLLIELMGKHSNIILLDSNNIIIDSIRHLNKLDGSNRDIFPGSIYTQVKNNKISFSSCNTFDSFYKCINSGLIDKSDIPTIISNTFIGISKSSISNFIESLQLVDVYNLDSLKSLYSYLKKIIFTISSDITDISCVLPDNNRKDYFLILKKQTQICQINFSLDDYYFSKESIESFQLHRNNLLKSILSKLKKLQDKLLVINSKLKECSKMEQYRLYGELITSNLYKINNYNQSSIILDNYYDDNNKIEIKLDSAISPSDNAKKFFKKYRKLQNTGSIVLKQKELIKNEINYIDSIIYEINSATTISELYDIEYEIRDLITIKNVFSKSKKDNSTSNLPTEYTIDGFTVLIGKNNKQNDYLTCKLAKNSDMWFHTKDIHGSHVVLKLPKKDTKVPDSILYKCATFAAFFSKAKLSQNVPVDYTYIKYVKKPNGAKPGMVIYTDNKTLYVNPQKPQ